ncbi:hypothetical protein [Streptomyces sp. MA5143a]|nr:hypothetical protein [Streptomyces sp. MA5143a]
MPPTRVLAQLDNAKVRPPSRIRPSMSFAIAVTVSLRFGSWVEGQGYVAL